MALSAACAKIGRPIRSLTQLPPKGASRGSRRGRSSLQPTAPQTAAVQKGIMNMTRSDLILFALSLVTTLILFALSLVTTSLPLGVTYTLLLAR